MPVLMTLLVLIVVLFLLNLRFKRDSGKVENKAPSLSHCPLCGSRLTPGQRVHTAAFPGEEERTAYVYGCPHCYDRMNSRLLSRRRTCPVCREQLRGEEHLLGRIQIGGAKNLLKILGCSRCHPYV